METTTFNPVQQHLLNMFTFDGSLERLNEVKEVLCRYFSQKLDNRLNELWDSGKLNQQKLDELRETDVRKYVSYSHRGPALSDFKEI